jgi:hypothetical protein
MGGDHALGNDVRHRDLIADVTLQPAVREDRQLASGTGVTYPKYERTGTTATGRSLTL